MKSLGVYMSLRGHLDWLPRRHSMFSGAYATAADNEQQCNENQNRSDQIQSIQMFTKKKSIIRSFDYKIIYQMESASEHLSIMLFCVSFFKSNLEIVINDKSRTIGSHCVLMRRKWSKMRTNIHLVRLQSQCYTYKKFESTARSLTFHIA